MIKLQPEMKIFSKTLRPDREQVWFRSPEHSKGTSQEKTVTPNFPKRWNIIRYLPDITNQPRCIFFPSGTRNKNRYLSWHEHGHADPDVDLCGLECGLC